MNMARDEGLPHHLCVSLMPTVPAEVVIAAVIVALTVSLQNTRHSSPGRYELLFYIIKKEYSHHVP